MSATAPHPAARPGAREDDPRVPTLFDLYPGTEAMEREVFDMFGIAFDDHPDLTRILMPEDWDGPPAAQGLRDRRDPGAVQGRRPAATWLIGDRSRATS